MSKIFKIALCGEVDESKDVTGLTEAPTALEPTEKSDKTITMTGPLSEVYTKALQIVFAKPNTENGIMAVESQANDVLMQIAMRKAAIVRSSNEYENVLDNEYVPENNVFVYSAYSDDLDTGKAVMAASTVASHAAEYPDDRTVLVVDGGDNGKGRFNELVPAEENSSLTVKTAIENLCKNSKVEVYYSFESFFKHLIKK